MSSALAAAPRRSHTTGALTRSGTLTRVGKPRLASSDGSTTTANSSWGNEGAVSGTRPRNKNQKQSNMFLSQPAGDSSLKSALSTPALKKDGALKSGKPLPKNVSFSANVVAGAPTTASSAEPTSQQNESFVRRSPRLSKNNSNMFLESSVGQNALRSSRSTPGLKSCLSVESQGESLERAWGKQHQTAAAASLPPKRNVSFTSIEFREHPITIGDNPSVSRGVPVSLDWYDEKTCKTTSMAVNEYEDDRMMLRRSRKQIALSGKMRESLLRDLGGYSRSDLKKAEAEANRVKNQRMQTVNKTKSHGKLGEQSELAMERTKNKFLKLIGARKTTKQQQEDLWEQAQISRRSGARTMPNFLDTTIRTIAEEEDKAAPATNEEWPATVQDRF